MAVGPYIAVGRVAGAHGAGGGLKVSVFSGDPSGIVGVSVLRLARERREGNPGGERDFRVEGARPRGGGALFFLAGLSTPEEARAWTGAVASVRRDELPPAGEDEYYWADLVGCAVVDPSGEPIGRVKAVEGGAAHDWLVVDRGGEEGMLPMVGAFILSVDIAGRRIVASPPPGW